MQLSPAKKTLVTRSDEWQEMPTVRKALTVATRPFVDALPLQANDH